MYGDPKNVIQYMAYQASPVPDNSSYILDLVPGMLQPLEINEIMQDNPAVDDMIKNLDIESIMKSTENLTKYVDPAVEKDMKRFAEPASAEMMNDFGKRKFAPSTKKKAMWAGRIFEQWKCICNYKSKNLDQLDNITDRTLLTLEVPELCTVLSNFIMEICKQNGEEYPHEPRYEIVLSVQHFMNMNG